MTGLPQGQGAGRAQSALDAGLSPDQAKLERRQLQWIEKALGQTATAPQTPSADHRLLPGLLELLQQCQRDWLEWRAAYVGFQRRLHASPPTAVPALVARFSSSMGRSGQQVRADRRAFERFMDVDVVAEQQQRRLGLLQRRMCFLLDRLACVGERVLRSHPGSWRELDLGERIGFLLGFDGQSVVTQAACRTLQRCWDVLPVAERGDLLAPLAANLHHLCDDVRSDAFLRAAALALVVRADAAKADVRLIQCIQQTQVPDAQFLRARALALLGPLPLASRLRLLEMAMRDPSAHVRQSCADAALVNLPEAWPVLDRLLREDAEPAVRGYAARSLVASLGWTAPEPFGRLLARLHDDPDPGVQRLLVESVLAFLHAGGRYDSAQGHAIGNALQALQHSTVPALHRSAVCASEWLWLRGCADSSNLFDYLQDALRELPLGRRCRIAWPQGKPVEAATLARVLACLCQRDFGVDFSRSSKGISLLRGEERVRRLWRILHEWRHPATDKRQGFLHTTGRRFVGDFVVPSGILAELSPTKVPGEPRYLESENGDRNYLPLLDHVLSALDSDWPTRPLRLTTAEGVTEIHPPAGLLARLRSKWNISRNFAHLAGLRNWGQGAPFDPAEFIRELERHGVQVRFVPHLPHNKWGVGFFSMAPIGLPNLWRQFSDYALSMYQNTLGQLAVFLSAVLALFLGRHAWLNQRVRSARRRIPLVVGGWGTRGKSGTERLKAALFAGLGYQVFSKTTGCEAMFLHSFHFQPMQELFLYRPYDKATIWEHASVMRMAAQLGSDVFLWECMGLNPDYVSILQSQWSRDDISTLTNTYPDHEDIQGPAGADIPRVMVKFIPRNGQVFTTEEEMLPILKTGARERGSPCEGIGWQAAFLLPPDLLERFPYQEHPSNIALVLGMARHLGMDEDQALKLMADHVVADLGVLKTSPVTVVRQRHLQFSNGMSANERRGCLSNWDRLGFSSEHRRLGRHRFVTVVVNNRADRVARSRVFASIIVRDLAADAFLLIGSNLDGLMKFIDEEWAQFGPALTLWPPGEAHDPLLQLQRIADRLRLPMDVEQVAGRLHDSLRGLAVATPDQAPMESPALHDWLRERLEPELADSLHAAVVLDLDRSGQWQELADKARASTGPDAALDSELRIRYRQWFDQKVTVIANFHATGNQVIDQIVRLTPPGLVNRVLGIQNIKGTGLDFVYRWQYSERCAQLCDQVLEGSRVEALRALDSLALFDGFSLLTEQRLREMLPLARQRPFMQSEAAQAELTLLESRSASAMEEIAATLSTGKQEDPGGQATRWLAALEQFLDAGDAVRRRRAADLIYAELVAGRISHPRAAAELAKLTQRQKGGWLTMSPDA